MGFGIKQGMENFLADICTGKSVVEAENMCSIYRDDLRPDPPASAILTILLLGLPDVACEKMENWIK